MIRIVIAALLLTFSSVSHATPPIVKPPLPAAVEQIKDSLRFTGFYVHSWKGESEPRMCTASIPLNNGFFVWNVEKERYNRCKHEKFFKNSPKFEVTDTLVFFEITIRTPTGIVLKKNGDHTKHFSQATLYFAFDRKKAILVRGAKPEEDGVI